MFEHEFEPLALATGDGAAIENERALELHAGEPTELLLFDLA